MAAQGRGRGWPTLTVVLLTIMPAVASEPGVLPAPAAPGRMCSEAMRSDACLADVCFVDAMHGWAVGDRGTIWHTADGGRRWHLQPSAVGCRLESVCFVDRENGWAAGGFSHPYTHAGTGVLLSTHDGGRRWTQNAGLLLPALKRVRFFDRYHGWAAGCPSALFSSGVFVTHDGGRSWNPLPGAKMTPWQGGDFLDQNTGVLAGFDGTAATVRRGAVQPARTPRFGLRRLADVELVPEVRPRVYGWLVGQGGLVMMTVDLGSTWQTPPAELPQGIAGQFDFAAIEVRGPKIWIAGSPGSRILHTPDAGRSWAALATGQSVPIKALSFVDDQHGWAVGHLGTILATTDGGRTWTRQRAGGSRAALLALINEPDDVPLELLAKLSGDEGYLAAVELAGRRDVESSPRGDVPPADRIHEAVVAVGACSARASWRFPLRQSGLNLAQDKVVEGWDRVNDGRAIDELEAHFVRQIRLWRPDVVVTHAAVSGRDDCEDRLVGTAAMEAVARAPDPTWYPEQITAAGLEPWKVRRVVGQLAAGNRGTTSLATMQLSARLGSTLADVASRPRGLVLDDFRPAPASIGFQILLDEVPNRSGRAGFFTGIALEPGGDARRTLSEPAAEGLDLIRRIAQRRRNTQAILGQAEHDPRQGLGFLAQVGELTRGLDPDSAGEILYQLGQHYYKSGQWPLSAEAFSRLADRYPEHPLSDAALTWLVQYYASEEASWRVRANNRITVQQASAPAIDPSRVEDRPERAAMIGKQIEATRPQLVAAPQIGFPLAVAARERGFPRDAERFYLGRRRGATRDTWWACAQGEQWLAQPEGPAPKPVLRCARAAAKLRLDGSLDDAIWQRAKPAALASRQHDDADWPATVMLAYDAEFLYLAVHCRQAPGARYETAEGPRPRDPDLSAQDRVDLLIDLDRDFTTYYRLTVDHRGWPRESCWGDTTWDPTWFVAAASEGGVWTAEAAVPLDQLTGSFPTSKAVWAIGIQRTVPGTGFQSWNTPAETRVVPEGFGYLIFE